MIITAAWAVLERSGFSGFKVQLVLRRAGVSARSFYRHFADKDALVVALMQDETQRAARLLTAAVTKVDASDPAGRVAAWIEGVIGAAADPRRVRRAGLFTTQQAVMRHFPAEAAAGTALLVEPLRAAIELGMEAGLFAWAAPERDARLIHAMAGSELTRMLSQPEPVAVDASVLAVTDFALRALGIAPS